MLDLDIVCMQEFACVHYELPGYEVILNIDERNRGTAILIRTGMNISDVRKSLDSRILAVTLQNAVTVVNVYAPSGSNNRTSRETFFNTALPTHMLQHAPFLIIVGDFNSIHSAFVEIK